MNNKTIILTGDRPTGPLHLGHFVGSLRQRVALQREYQQFVLVADLQGLTDNGSNPQKIRNNIPEVLADYLAAGIDPSLTTICLQSALPALAELTALYMNIVTVARVERNPTVKNEIMQKGFARSLPVGSWFTRSARRQILQPSKPALSPSATINYRCSSRLTKSYIR